MKTTRSTADIEPADDVERYLREIGATPLLNAEQEAELARLMNAGRAAARRLESGEPISPQLHITCTAEIAQAHDARRHLIQANLRLVVSIAKKYQGHGLALLDLIQEGNIGLMRAVEKFDHTKGNRFSTYATWWIRQAITRALADQSRTIRLPVHIGETISQIKRATEAGELSDEQIAAITGLSIKQIRRARAAQRMPISLDTPIGLDDGRMIGEIVADPSATDPAEYINTHDRRRAILNALEKLPERERKVLILRYGLADDRHRTLEEVGAAFGITRERVRQIEAEALRKLRHPHLSRPLRRYMD
jgi:RNA polymerase primary sigma factor